MLFHSPVRLLAAATLCLAATPQSIELEGGVFRVSGWAAPPTPPARGWAQIFAVYAGSGSIPPMLGSYAVDKGFLVFRPAFPLAAGMRYRAVFHPPVGPAIERIFDGPLKQTTPATRVESVYPSGALLPSNLLRLYIYFSAPMTQGEAFRCMHLVDEKGKDLQGVFLPGEELWDPKWKRLTMTFDPGRLKRGLTANIAMGPPIVEGRHYTLVIDRMWPDAHGLPLMESYRRSFRGGPAQRTKPDPAEWRVDTPVGGTSTALSVTFPEPMNYVLLKRMIEIVRDAHVVAGSVAIDYDERRWLFTPRDRWKPGDYRLVIDTALEDVAGNSIAHAFDIDVFEEVTEHLKATKTSLPFVVK